MLTFELHGGLEAGQKFVEALELHSHVANIGDVRSLVIHPASTTHSQLTAEEQLTTGVTPGLVRLAVGLEGIEDILADLEAGLPRRQGGLTWAGGSTGDGDPVGDRPVPRPARPVPAGARRAPARGAGRLRDVGDARGRRLERGADRARAHRRQPRRRPGRSGAPTPGWWDGLIGPGAPLDTDRFFVVCANVLGGCQGTTGPSSLAPDDGRWGSRFPEVTVGDQVRVEAALADALGIARWACVVGGSMGGMRALEWAVAMPDRVATLFFLASGAVATADQIGTQTTQQAAIRADPRWAGGDYDLADPPVDGLGIARRIAHLTYRSAFELGERFGTVVQDDGRYAVASYLDHHARQAGPPVRRRQLRAAHRGDEQLGRRPRARRVEAALAAVTARAVVAGVDSDRLYPIAQQQQVAEALGVPLQVIASPYGHDGFLIEVGAVGALLRDLLDCPDGESRSRTAGEVTAARCHGRLRASAVGSVRAHELRRRRGPRQFPALRSGTAHFDGPGGTQVPESVARAVAETLTSSIANRGRVTAAERLADDVVLGAGRGRRPARRRPARRRLRPQRHPADLRPRPHAGRGLGPGRRGGRLPARPRRERPPVGARRRGRGRDGALGRLRPGHRRAHRRRRRRGAHRADPAGRGHRRLQPDRHPAAVAEIAALVHEAGGCWPSTACT